MTHSPTRRSAIAGVTLFAASLPLAACGGGGGDGVRSTPVPPVIAPPPAPPAPSPPPNPPPRARAGRLQPDGL